jgi:hypothetical protein
VKGVEDAAGDGPSGDSTASASLADSATPALIKGLLEKAGAMPSQSSTKDHRFSCGGLTKCTDAGVRWLCADHLPTATGSTAAEEVEEKTPQL